MSCHQACPERGHDIRGPSDGARDHAVGRQARIHEASPQADGLLPEIRVGRAAWLSVPIEEPESRLGSLIETATNPFEQGRGRISLIRERRTTDKRRAHGGHSIGQFGDFPGSRVHQFAPQRAQLAIFFDRRTAVLEALLQ